MEFSNDRNNGLIRVDHEGCCLWGYRYGDTPKPHVSRFGTPSGHNAVLASPHDHVHHRGLMFAATVDQVNFWEESGHSEIPQNGVIRHDAWDSIQPADDRISLTEGLTWLHDDTPMLREERRLCISLEPEFAAVRCDWSSRLTGIGRDRLLTGKTPYAAVTYHGLGIRFARALDWGGAHLNPEGIDGQAPDPGNRSPWHVYQGKVDETHAPVGVWVGDSPSNLHHPTPWFTVSHPPAPFAFVSAAVMAHGPVPLPVDQPVTLDYSVWVRDGHWTRQDGIRAWQIAFGSVPGNERR